MAEVLAPIVQQPSTINMLQSGDAFQNSSQAQQRSQQSRQPQASRVNLYNSNNGVLGYRQTSAAPVAPYAFQATPKLSNGAQSQQSMHGRQGQTSTSSASTASTGSSSRSKDDSSASSAPRSNVSVENRPKSLLSLSPSFSEITLPNFESTAKPSPGRYRRNQRQTESSTTSTPTAAPQEKPAAPKLITPSTSEMTNVAKFHQEIPSRSPIRPGHLRAGSVDDLQVNRSSNEAAKRYRRRSISGFDSNMFNGSFDNTPLTALPPTPLGMRKEGQSSLPSPKGSSPAPNHERQHSGESASSGRPSSSRRENKAPSPRPASPTTKVNVPPRGSSDAAKRMANPSPLSRSTVDPDTVPKSSQPDHAPLSTASQHLQAVTEKDSGKGKKSRLRRAFSFGSAAELKRAATENNHQKLQKHRTPEEEREAEQDAIAAQQEAAGLGASIYSGQGGFIGSTDNISISSTASSASVMLRKMGKGMKKGGRSLKGLFRPKSVVGVPAADAPVAPSAAQVSMVTVEAEREKVNVNVDPHDQSGGGTGFPKLQRNSVDAASEIPGSSHGQGSGSDSWARKSIIGGERERAEVLAAVKKGILKRTGTGSSTSSPSSRPVDTRVPELSLPGAPHAPDSPRSSAPSTPNDDQPRSVPVGHTPGDYFMGAPRFNGSTKSLPTTAARNISFSPRIQFHDAWSPAEYDRRGDIATCNRLTPMLAQQIKEELNTFKMEMEVHEMSKPYTHFF